MERCKHNWFELFCELCGDEAVAAVLQNNQALAFNKPMDKLVLRLNQVSGKLEKAIQWAELSLEELETEGKHAAQAELEAVEHNKVVQEAVQKARGLVAQEQPAAPAEPPANPPAY